jgi:integrase
MNRSAKLTMNEMPTFSEQSKIWLSTINNKAVGTIKLYTNVINFWDSKIGDMYINEIKYSKILIISTNMGWKPKYHNDQLIPLRGVFNLAMKDGIITKNPLDGLANEKVQKTPPDPFTIEEVNLITAHMADNYSPQVLNYFEFMFFTGARPEEAIALRWSEIDFNDSTARIRRVRTAHSDRETTKTNLIRDIELNSRALKALLSQKAHTFLENDYVFHNPETNKRWSSEAKQNLRYWKPTIKKLGIRYRVPYQARHTFATLNLMAGANPMWVSEMMGHANMQMLLEVYAKWIKGADKQKEKQKIEVMFEDNSHQTATKITQPL